MKMRFTFWMLLSLWSSDTDVLYSIASCDNVSPAFGLTIDVAFHAISGADLKWLCILLSASLNFISDVMIVIIFIFHILGNAHENGNGFRVSLTMIYIRLGIRLFIKNGIQNCLRDASPLKSIILSQNWIYVWNILIYRSAYINDTNIFMFYCHYIFFYVLNFGL